MSFDIERLVEFCIMEISKFAEHHKDENFYGFSIDANLLCLNSEEAAAATLNEYINNWETRHRTFNDWQELTEQDGFVS